MLNADLLKLLCCPETRQPLAMASQALIDDLNRRIAGGKITNRAGQRVGEPLEGGLTRADGAWLYPIRQQIPILLIDEAIPLTHENKPFNPP